MKKIVALAAFASFCLSTTAQKKTAAAAPATSILKNATDSLSYAIGLQVGGSLKQSGIDKINYALYNKGMADNMGSNKTPLMTTEKANETIQQKLQAFMAKKSAALKAEGEAFLAKNKTKKGVNTTASGIQYEVLEAGKSGDRPNATDTVVAHYAGTLINGKEFDNSFKRGQPATFPLQNVIRGWTEILQLMTIGDKWKVYIPADLAYGMNPPSADIPPNAMLIFEINLLEIKRTAPPQVK
jgi:FKBP-type peptidyl-prolyl cis-trans isomerase FklB